MNKKQLFIAAVAAVLSVSGVNASVITGVEGSGGIFNIKPEHVNGDVGYRQYDQFELSKGDIANLIYKYGQRDLETFINLVDGQVKIDGILNTMRDGNFYNGHAIFISPNGMVVGASGVLNVGSLSVVTPTDDKYNTLKGDYAARNYTNINQISKLKQDSNADITIAGKVFARNGVDLRGANINVSGDILNGVKAADALTSEAQANNLFNSLVNTDGIVQGNAFESNGSSIVIKSGDKTDGSKLANAGINISGKVINHSGGETALTNHGGKGLTVTGNIQANNKLNLYNTNGNLNIAGKVSNTNAALSISNKGGDLDIGNKANISTDNALEIVNNGTGHLAIAGKAVSTGKTDIVNEGKGGMNISGTVGNTSTHSVRIVNRNGELVIASTANVSANDTLRVENSGSGMSANGTLTANKKVSIENKAGNLNINGKVAVTKGDITILNNGDKLTLASDSNIAGNGNVSIKNNGSNGMTLEGTITNTGETAINNTKGQLLANGTITNEGNIGIINQGTGLVISKNAKITNKGTTKIVNTGENGMSVVGSVDNTGNLYFYNDNGQLSFTTDSGNTTAAKVANRNGNIYIASRKDATGISSSSTSTITNENGNIIIRNKGEQTSENSRGLDLQGTISNKGGDVAINNDKNDMYISGNINVENGNLGIINNAGAGKADFASSGKINITGGNANIKNEGSGDMTVNSEITHNGRLNILGNSGYLTLGGIIHNNSNGNLDDNNGFYAASRANGTGINVTSGFKGDGSGQYLIKNISGDNGLRYQGNINTSAQAELYNQKGDMTVGGSLTGKPAVILNTGDKLTVNGTVSSETDAKVVNKGSAAADVSKATVNTPNEKWFYEKLKK